MPSKTKIININLGQLTEEGLLKLLKTNEAGLEEMLSLMECFFDLFSCAIHFGSVLQNYAEQLHPDFSARFQKLGLEVHDVKGQDLLQALSSHSAASAVYLH